MIVLVTTLLLTTVYVGSFPGNNYGVDPPGFLRRPRPGLPLERESVCPAATAVFTLTATSANLVRVKIGDINGLSIYLRCLQHSCFQGLPHAH